jgi:hypothetical protein
MDAKKPAGYASGLGRESENLLIVGISDLFYFTARNPAIHLLLGDRLSDRRLV